MKNLSYLVDDSVAVISIDLKESPVNTLGPQVLAELEEVMTRAASDTAASALVIISGKPDSFVAGADIEMLEKLKTSAEATALARQAQSALDRLDAFEKPVVAAIHGACLGGGLEWVLACDYRIATDGQKTVLGLPEVQLGLIPGAGGTQRLPRIIGVQGAIDLIATGKTLKGKKALKRGLIDELVPQPILLEVAKRRARELAKGTLTVERTRGMAKGRGLAGLMKGLADKEAWAELALEENPVGRRVLFDQAKKQVLKKTKGKYPAPERALETIRIGLERGMQAGLESEAQAFGELVVTDVSRRLVEIFFATAALKKDNGTNDSSIRPRPITKLGLVGGGLMGAGIAYVASATQKVDVRIKEADAAGVGRSLAHVRGLYDERVRRRSISHRELDKAFARVSATTEWAGFKRCELVIEAVPEELSLKHKVLQQVEGLGGPDVIFASNTSSLPIAEIAKASKHPETVIGMHYFSPVNKMPLLEVITHPGTAPWVVATCVEVGKRQGKTVIVVSDGVGFYTSRVLAPYLNEAAFILAEGAEVADIDRALVDLGFPVGPMTLLDEVGIDVATKVSKIMHRAFGARVAPPTATDALVADGRLGRKSGRGFYRYEQQKKREVDETVYSLLPQGSRRTRVDRAEVADRCLLQFMNEAVRCLGEGIIRSARDGDIGAIYGLGFPPYLGGPFRACDARGVGRVLERLEHYHERFGERFTPAPLFFEMVKAGKKFYP